MIIFKRKMDRPSQQNLKKRYAQLADQLSRMGRVLPGTITERTIIGQASKKQIDRKKYGPYYYYSDVLDFDSSGHSETFFSMRLIGNIITARMIPDNFDCSL